jgi:hypothetical protein
MNKTELFVFFYALLLAGVMMIIFKPYVVKWTHCAYDFRQGILYQDDNYNCMDLFLFFHSFH